MTRLRLDQRGFTYIGLLLVVAIMGVTLAAAGELWSTASKREKEAQLLFAGDEFRRAIGSYYESSPGVKQFPQQLEDLLEDRRFPMVRRHLRKVYVDPITNATSWGLVKQGDRILGVHSVSTDKPLKIANFKREDEGFSDSRTYADWRFVYQPVAGVPVAPRALAPPPIGAPAAPASLPPAEADRQAFQQRQAAQVPRPPWVCSATRSNDLRNCERARNLGDGGSALDACQHAAAEDYRICMATALKSTGP